MGEQTQLRIIALDPCPRESVCGVLGFRPHGFVKS